jgi:uncharacterized protein YcfJ
MNKQLLVGVGIGLIAAGTVGALAGYSMSQKHPDDGVTNAPLALEAAPAAAAVADGAAAVPINAAQTDAPAVAASSGKPSDTRHATKSPERARSGAVESTRETLMARVVSSTPAVITEKVARQQCHDEQVVRQKPVKDEKRIAGAALGAVLGGVLGHQVGDGDGRKIATVAGAAAGGYAGSKTQKYMQERNTETVTEQRCETVYDTKEKRVGFDVTYQANGTTHTTRLVDDPGVGAMLPIHNGEVVLATR